MDLNLDLNFPPTVLAEGDLVSSSSNIDRGAALEAPNSEIIGSTVIDLEATDDDVELFLSPAWLKRRNQLYQVEEVPPMQSGYTVEDPVTTLSLNSFNYPEPILMRSGIIDCVIPHLTKCEAEHERNEARVRKLEAKLAQAKEWALQSSAARDVLKGRMDIAQRNLARAGVILADFLNARSELSLLSDDEARLERARANILDSRNERMVALAQQIRDLTAPPQ